MDPLQFVAFAALGVLLGTFGTIIGAGGGFLLVPILLLLGWPHQEAAATSLFMVTANAVLLPVLESFSALRICAEFVMFPFGAEGETVT